MPKLLTLMLLFPLLIACAQSTQPAAPDTMTTTASFLNIPFQTIAGDTTSLAAFNGKVLLLVNVASKCGYTPQYDGLEKLYEKYKDRGLVVIGFPANNFGAQEPGTNAEILSFCKANYGVTFPMMAKISVKGDDMHPLYQFLTTHADPAGDITWNFNKFLLDRNGQIAARFDKKITPDDPALTAKIDLLLK
jgi:glutathione peroxidase